MNPGEQVTLTFPIFMPQYASQFIFEFVTHLPGDNIPTNDTLRLTTLIGIIQDVAPTTVLQPQTILPPEPFTPQVIVFNLGNTAIDAFHTTCQVDTGAAGSFLYLMDQWISPLEIGGLDTVGFQPILLINPGRYRFLFKTHWEADHHPENDSLEFWAEFPAASNYMKHEIIKDFSIEGCFPNPFNVKTSLRLRIPQRTLISMDLYRLDGCKVSSFQFGVLDAGIQTVSIDANHLPSGVYIGCVHTESTQQNLKVVLLK